MTRPNERIDLTAEPDFRIGDIAVRPRSLEIARGGAVRELQPLLVKVLIKLARSSGESVSRAEFLEWCWDGLSLSDSALNRTISNLRTPLRELGSQIEIRTLRGIGYRLIEPAAASDAAAATPPALPFWRRLPKFSWGVAGGFAAAAGLAFALFLLPFARGGAAPPDYDSIAVLQFEDMSPSSSLDYLAHGAEVEIREGLALADGSLRVSARASSTAEELSDRSPAEIGRILDVDVLVEGVIRDVDQAPRLSLTLLEAHSGRSIWNRSFHLSVENLETVRAIVVSEVMRALHREAASASPQTDGNPVDPRASVELMKADDLLANGDTDSILRAKVFYEAALDLDPNLASAYLGLVRATLADEGHADHNQARMYLDHAIELAPWARETLLTEQVFNDHLRNEGFGADWLSRPNEPRRDAVLDFAAQLRTLVIQSRLHEAEALVEEILEVDPIGVETNVYVARVLNRRGRSDDALKTLDRALTYSPNSLDLMFWRVNALAESGDLPGTLEQLVTMLELAPGDHRTRYFMAHLLGQLGFSTEAYTLALDGPQRMRVLNAGEDDAAFMRLSELELTKAGSLRHIALIHIMRGDLRGARDSLEHIRRRQGSSHYFEHPNDYKPYLSLAYREAGEEERAAELDQEILDEINRQIELGDDSVVLFLPYRAIAAAARNDANEAFALLDRAAAGGYILFNPEDAAFAGLRDEQGYGERLAEFRRIRAAQRAEVIASGTLDRVHALTSAMTMEEN